MTSTGHSQSTGRDVTDEQLRVAAAKPCDCGAPWAVAAFGPCVSCAAAAALDAREQLARALAVPGEQS